MKNTQKYSFKEKDLTIELECHGQTKYTKTSYPVKYGIFSRVETRDYIFEFNLNHEIKHAISRKKDWPHPSEWLKRTMGNDWIYYSSGGYSGVYEALGEYYLPNLMYPTNSLLGGKPFLEKEIDIIVSQWHQILASCHTPHLPEPFAEWMTTALEQTPEKLNEKARTLFDICGSRVSVMPPDARHVDYNIIPINISDGCLYKCRFCKIKNHKKFTVRSWENINTQMTGLKDLYRNDIINYNALFLGEHDALNAPEDVILETAQNAYTKFSFATSYMESAFLFIFASVDSLLNKTDAFFKSLNDLGFQTCINVGLESCDPDTLALIGKPITSKQVRDAFKKIQIINDGFPNIEVSCNFVMDEDLPGSHYNSVMELIRDGFKRTKPKGCVYFSPLKFGQPSRQVLYDFYRLKTLSRLPTFLYLIQRL